MKLGKITGMVLAVFIVISSSQLSAKDNFKFIDVSAHVNTPLDASVDGEYSPFKKLKNGEVRNFGGIDFKIGNGALRITSQKKITITLPANTAKYKYLYILSNTGEKKWGNAVNMAQVFIDDGRSQNRFYPKKTTVGGSPLKEDSLENAKSVYGGNGDPRLYISHVIISNLDDGVKKIDIIPDNLCSWNIMGITLSDKKVPTGKTYKIGGQEWKAVDTDNLEIVEGSALDVSNLMTPAPAGKFGRVIVNNNGHFAFSDKPNERVKFKGTNMRPGGAFGRTLKTHKDIDILARKFRKQGYNLLRWRISMNGSREFDAPYSMKKEIRDLYDYLIFALAREGVYSHWNLSSHDLGESGFKWIDRFDVKCRFIFGDPSAREAWRKLMLMQLNHVNPYTGKAWKDDASIASIEYFNELDTLYPFHSGMSKKGRDFGDSAFQKWAGKKYKSIDALNAVWKTSFKSFKEVVPFNNAKHRNTVDIPQFVIDASREMQQFCEKVIREEIGCKAPIHQHNCVIRTDVYLLSAEAGSYMANNVYFCHPSMFMQEGSFVGQKSSLTSDYCAAYWLHAANKRIAGRPYVLTEYQHSHWNQFKHEAGVLFPAYSAFQNFDNLTIHDLAVSNQKHACLGSFKVYNSPVYRANEFLSCFLFMRGDVTPSPNRVDVVYDKKYVESSPMMGRGMNHEQAKIAFMTGFGIDFPSARKIDELKNIKVVPANMQLKPEGAAKNVWNNGANPEPEIEKKYFDIAAMSKNLKDRGILTKDNISAPENGIYQSDTKELTVDFNNSWVKVVTPKTEAVALKPETKNMQLDRLTIKSTSVPAAVAVVSIDNKPIDKSKRMVLVYNTDNASSGSELSISRERLISTGSLPIIVRTGKLSAELKMPQKGFFEKLVSAKKYSVYALKLNGERAEKIPFEISDGKMKIELDTSKLKEPAVFYEIVEE